MREHDFGPPAFPEGTPVETPEILAFIFDQEEREQTYKDSANFDPKNLLDEWEFYYFENMEGLGKDRDAIIREILLDEDLQRGINVKCFASLSKGRNSHGKSILRKIPRVVVLVTYSGRTFEATRKPFENKIDVIASEAFPEVPSDQAVERLKTLINQRVAIGDLFAFLY